MYEENGPESALDLATRRAPAKKEDSHRDRTAPHGGATTAEIAKGHGLAESHHPRFHQWTVTKKMALTLEWTQSGAGARRTESLRGDPTQFMTKLPAMGRFSSWGDVSAKADYGPVHFAVCRQRHAARSGVYCYDSTLASWQEHFRPAGVYYCK
jgi:hypothetical protein